MNTEKTALEMYKDIVDELVVLHKKHDNESFVNVISIQNAALEILKQQIFLDTRKDW